MQNQLILEIFKNAYTVKLTLSFIFRKKYD